VVAEPASKLTDDDREAIRQLKPFLLAHLGQWSGNLTPACGLQAPRGTQRLISPAESIISTCQKHGLQLSIDGDDICVGDIDHQPWPSLVMAIEAHREEVAALIMQGVNSNLEPTPKGQCPDPGALAYGAFTGLLEQINDRYAAATPQAQQKITKAVEKHTCLIEVEFTEQRYPALYRCLANLRLTIFNDILGDKEW